MKYGSSHQQGVALISALIVLALVTGATVAMVAKQSNGIELATNTIRYNQVNNYSEGIILWAEGALLDDADENDTDSPLDIWNQRLVDVEIEGGEIDAVIVDLQSKFNLNNLALSDEAGELARERFRRLLNLLNITVDFTDAIADWIDADTETRFPNGAEDTFYLALDEAYRTSNLPFVSVSELLLVKDVSVEDYEKLLPHICVLPAGTNININTAEDEVLMSLSSFVGPGGVDAIKTARLTEPSTLSGDTASVSSNTDNQNSDLAGQGSTNQNQTTNTNRNGNNGRFPTLSAVLAVNPNLSSSQQTTLRGNCFGNSLNVEQRDRCVEQLLEQFVLNENGNDNTISSNSQNNTGAITGNTDDNTDSQTTAIFPGLNLEEQFQLDPNGLTGVSQYFLVQGTVEQYNRKMNFSYILNRDDGGQIEVIARGFNEPIIGLIVRNQ